jgi:branched-chain amino acid aminotransferase
MKDWLNLNGSFIEEKSPVIRADNRAFRYGDGLFETMKVIMGAIRLRDLHFERLFRGMEVLEIRVQGLISARGLETEILRTVKKNHIAGPARVRLTMYRGDGSLYEFKADNAGYIIQTWPLSSSNLSLNHEGLTLGLYEEGKKSIDGLSSLKTNNYLVYAMGALHAKKNRFNDCLILNSNNRICDSTIANVFWVKDRKIYTPPLSEGCVAGVMRANLLERIPNEGLEVTEKETTENDLLDADEVFLTNALNGIRWVRQFKDKTYTNAIATRLYHATI